MRALSIAVLSMLIATPAGADVDLSGNWIPIRHEDVPDRGPGVGLGDYTGIPLSESGRRWAEAWDAARLSLPEEQCRVHVGHYILRGPQNLRIWEEKDPRTQEVVAIKQYISTYEQSRTIWMDGRPHPPPYARHTWMGFSTGRWVGDRLVVETTHMKQGWHRRNGTVASDWTTMTEHYVRHGDVLTHISVMHDPVYLDEPLVKSVHFRQSIRALDPQTWLWPCTPVEETVLAPGEVPHFLPGENPHLEPTRAEAHLLVPGVEGGPATTYPEWRSSMQASSEAAGGPGAGGRSASRRNNARAAEQGPLESVRPQAPASADDPIEIWPVRDNVFMLVGAGANSTVQIGDDGVLIVDTKLPGASEQLIASLRTLTDRPIRYIVNTSMDLDHLGNNAAIAAAGSRRTGGVVVRQIGEGIAATAAIVAHENVLLRVSAPTGEQAALPFDAWPTDTFFLNRRDLTVNAEGIEVLHLPDAHTDGDTIVFFRRSDVVSAGDVYSTTSYPHIDVENGGTIQGYLAAVNRLIEIAIPDVDQQGGTLIVPGHGRLSDEMDVVEYRDMITIVRDRVAEMIDRGLSLADVQAARPTFEFDARYGAEDGPWTTRDFVAAVYQGLSAEADR